ncbi:hypothetical protein [Alteraurantiacibacter aquimixticola]|uniref:Secreted protein n=1 Tax=Alteraurantiacibacter aquimixticola TaxID=2489173 RepID=A0A4T3F677_9SPHN|nr:hypothetical protein [Alteraurantiacibacter aquimixticola]TIX51924.1 hypothetical protein E5222_05660 [Alteraurantiacibacter aquimixticola]
MIKIIVPASMVLILAACGEPPMAANDLTAPGNPELAATVDFGDDNGDYSNDSECDDPRFEGPGMTATPLLDEDIRHDATDCRTAFERGELQLRK